MLSNHQKRFVACTTTHIQLYTINGTYLTTTIWLGVSVAWHLQFHVHFRFTVKNTCDTNHFCDALIHFVAFITEYTWYVFVVVASVHLWCLRQSIGILRQSYVYNLIVIFFETPLYTAMCNKIGACTEWWYWFIIFCFSYRCYITWYAIG